MNKNINKLRPAKSIEINQKVYEMKRNGEKVITLSLGEAYFDIPNNGKKFFDIIHRYPKNKLRAFQYVNYVLEDKLVSELQEVKNEELSDKIGHKEIVF